MDPEREMLLIQKLKSAIPNERKLEVPPYLKSMLT
jgi:hypothetical protein